MELGSDYEIFTVSDDDTGETLEVCIEGTASMSEDELHEALMLGTLRVQCRTLAAELHRPKKYLN